MRVETVHLSRFPEPKTLTTDSGRWTWLPLLYLKEFNSPFLAIVLFKDNQLIGQREQTSGSFPATLGAIFCVRRLVQDGSSPHYTQAQPLRL